MYGQDDCGKCRELQRKVNDLDYDLDSTRAEMARAQRAVHEERSARRTEEESLREEIFGLQERVEELEKLMVQREERSA